MSKSLVLVVDDDEKIVATIKIWLDAKGYAVDTAKDGVEAYEKLKSEAYYCMLLDINMPRVNGVELILLLQEECLDIPTVVMAGFDDFQEDELQQFRNVVRFLKKPFTGDQLSAALQACAAS
jgi:DNA-binding response OmpR family regulator